VETIAVRVTHSRTKVTISGTADPASVQHELRAELGRVPLARPNRLDVRVRARRHPHGGDRHHHHHRRLAEQPHR
jgi:hypothetical protein